MAKQRAPRVRLPAIALAAPLALLGAVLSTPAVAEIRVLPSVSVRETFSDNPALTVEKSESQFITDLSPSVTALLNGPRVKLAATATAHLYGYSGQRPPNGNATSLQLTSGGKADLIQDLLYVDGALNRSQQSIFGFGQQSQNGYSNANNDDVITWRISPYLVHRFGNFASGQLRYTRDSVQASRGLLGTSKGDGADLNLTSGPSFTTVGWNVQASHKRIDDSLAGESDIDNAVATLRYRLKNSLSVYANSGYDRYSYTGLTNSFGGKSYAGGFTWTPSQRTSIDASIGHRSFGKTYSLAANLRSRMTVWNASYNDSITTAREQFLRPGTIDTAALLDSSFAAAFPDPIERHQAVLAYLAAQGIPASLANNVNYFSNRLLLQKQFQASVVLRGTRSSLIASIANTKRQALSPPGVDAPLTTDLAVSGLNDNTHQTTATVGLNYRLTARTSASLSGSRARILSTTTGILQNQTNYSFMVTSQLASKLSGNVELRRNEGDSFDARGRIYREDAISVSLNYKL